MATIRQGYLDDFTLKNQKVGIGTSTANEKLEVLGGTRGGDVVVTGIATLTSYEGFQNKKTSYVENIGINEGTSGTLSGEIVIGSGTTLSVGTGATTGQGSLKSLKVSNTFIPPCGGTADRPSAAKPGTIYYNRDFKTIEYWDGSFWRQVDNVTTSGRGFATNGDRTTPSIDQINISTKGNAISKHYSTLGRNATAGCSNSTRGLLVGGATPSKSNVIEYITMASSGDAIDFGDLPTNYGSEMSACASSTRGLFGGGYFPARSNAISYVQINTLGNSQDFGDLTSIMVSVAALSSPTRAIFWGGYRTSPGSSNDIDMVTIASKGKSVDFGSGDSVARTSGCSNTTRGMVGGGRKAPGNPAGVGDEIDYITIASTGNTIYFGDLTVNRVMPGGCSSQTRAVWMGGYDHPVKPRTIDYVEIATTGNATNFGEATQGQRHSGGFSDSHGGLGGF